MYRCPTILREIKSTRLRWTGEVSRMEEDRSSFQILTDKPIGRTTLRWEKSVRMHLKELHTNERNWIDCAQDSDY